MGGCFMDMTEQERRFNRRVNFYLMNRIWKYIHGKKGKEISFLYEQIGLTDNLFSKIIRDVDYSTKKLDQKWGKYTSIMGDGLEDYMKGYQLIPVDGITKEDWEKYLEARYAEQNGTPLEQTERNKIMGELNDKLKAVINGLSGETNQPIDLLYYFCKYERAKAIQRPPYYRLEELENILSGLSFSQWESAPDNLFERVFPMLKKQYELAATIKNYHLLKNEDR